MAINRRPSGQKPGKYKHSPPLTLKTKGQKLSPTKNSSPAKYVTLGGIRENKRNSTQEKKTDEIRGNL